MLDTTVPFGSVDFTAAALVGQADDINAMVPAMDANSNYALATALEAGRGEAQGDAVRHRLRARRHQVAGLDHLQGAYFLSPFRPWPLPNAGTKQMQAAMEKYAHFTKTQFPSFGQYEAWAGADLMIKGLELAGPNPTRAAVIKDLRGLKSYNANGLLPQSIDYSTIFGHDPAKTCAWVMEAEKTGFKVASWTQPVCGTDIPGTSTASAS